MSIYSCLRGLSLGALLLLLSTSLTSAVPQLTDARVKKLAAEFCRAIGHSVAPPSTSRSVMATTSLDSTPSQFIGKDAVHWQNRWKVSFPDQADVHISDETGKVSLYMNTAYFHHNDHSPAGKALPKAEAVQRATAVLMAEGAPLTDMVLDDVREHQDGAEAQGHEWVLWWRRTYKGLPYRNQFALVSLQAETGEVISAGAGTDLLPPPTVEESVTRTQAVAIGQAQLSAAGITGTGLAWAEKLIIQPDTFWQNGDERPFSNATRTAWLCGFDAQGTTYGVWVDTATGDVIGGTIGGTLGGGPVKRQKPIFGHQIKRSDTAAKTVR